MPLSSFRTSDLAMAVYLSLNGQVFSLEKSDEEGVAAFAFNPVLDEETIVLERLVNTFNKGRARVEPRKFMKEAGAVRGRLYDFIDGKTDADAE